MSHALLSASGSKRWMACPPSARYEQLFEDSTSDAAIEGTLAHELAEAKLRLAYDPKYNSKKYDKALDKIEAHKWYCAAMEDYIDGYVDKIVEILNSKGPNAKIMLEQKLDFSQWVPDGYGTGDVVIIDDGVIEVIDLKYGKGVPVTAEDNPQLRLYGLGAYDTFSLAYDFHTVRMSIIQPRLDTFTTEEMSADDLVAWAEDYVKPKADLAFNGEGDFCSGDHCRFCKGAAVCKARAKNNMSLEQKRTEHPNTMSVEEIADVLGRVDELVKWAEKVKSYALEQAENGVKFPGFKLVEGRSNRIISNKDAAAEALIGAGYAEAVIYERNLYGLTALEKIVGKKKFDEVLGALIIKPSGKPTLTTEDDKRPEINSKASAEDDFADSEYFV